MRNRLLRVTRIVAIGLLVSSCATSTPSTRTAVIFAESAEVAARSVERVGGQITHRLHLINAVGASISDPQLAELSTDSALLRAVVSESGSASAKSADMPASQEIMTWLQASLGRSAVNNKLQTYLEAAAPELTGQGIGIALIDTGISVSAFNRDANSPVRYAFNAVNDTYHDIEDDTGHGTHLASLIAGFGDSFRGVAPNADIVAIKAFDNDDTASILDVIRAIQWVVDHKDAFNIRVLNLSISAQADLPYYLDPMNIALTKAWSEGLTVVVSAGNGGPQPSSITAPGNNPWLITVGAADYVSDQGWTDVAPFSGRGPTATGHIKPDILVPGTLLAGVRAPNAKRPEAEPDHRDPEGFWITSGASQASAIASGLIALILESRPGLSNHDVKCILANTALPLLSDTNDLVSPLAQGRGLLDLKAALKSDQTDCPERLDDTDPTLPLKGSFSHQQ